MAVIYEHWRPDLNVCFYVGASINPKSRPHKYSHKNNRFYKEVLNDLDKAKLKPYAKIIWSDIPDDCISAYEKMRIVYQRALIGERLTNITEGGLGTLGVSGDLHPRWGKTKKDFPNISKSGNTNSMFGRTGKQNARSKPVREITSGVVYESARLAAKQLGVSSSGITNVCKGKRKTSGGYIFQYAEQ